MAEDQYEQMLTPKEAAELIKVDPKTVTRWARAGYIGSAKTIGGHRRIPESEVRRILRLQPATRKGRRDHPEEAKEGEAGGDTCA